MGSKSGNLTQYQWKRWQHRFVDFLDKSQNQAYLYEKCIWMVTFLAGKSFDIRLLFEKIKSMVPIISIFLENQHWKLPNPQLKIENIMKIQLTQKFDLDTQIRREVVQKSFKTFKLYVFNNITCIYMTIWYPKINFEYCS